MVIYNQDKAKEIVSKVYEINQRILGPVTVTPDFEKTKGTMYNTTFSQATLDFLEMSENKERPEYVSYFSFVFHRYK